MFSLLPAHRCFVVGTALMVSASAAWAVSSDEIAAINSIVSQQADLIERHRAGAIAGILKAMPALSDKQASELANALLGNPALFSALQSLGDNGHANLFAHFASLLQGGVGLNSSDFESFLAKVQGATLLQDLGISSVNSLTSPELERKTTPTTNTATAPSSITKQADFDEAYYLAQNPDVAAVVTAGAFASGWAHYAAYGRAEGRFARAVGTSPSTTSSTPTTAQPSSAASYDDIIKELRALLEDVEIEIADGTTGAAGSITQRIVKSNHPLLERVLTGKGKPEEVAVMIKSLIGTLNSNKDASAAALKSTVDDAKLLLALFAPTGNSSPTQQLGTTTTTQAIDDATRRAMQTSTPSPAATPTPAPAKLCYKVGTETMCH